MSRFDSTKVIEKIGKRVSTSEKLKPYLQHSTDMSVARMADRIAQSVSNFDHVNDAMQAYSGLEGIYTLDASARNYDAQMAAAQGKDFSAGPGMNAGASTTRGVDVVDMTLIATVQSVLPTLAVDFGMAKPTDVLAYQGLVAVNEHGEVAAGDDVVTPFKPLNYKAVTSIKGAILDAEVASVTAGTPSVTDLGAPIARGTVRVILNDGTEGSDVKGDGDVYFLGASTVAGKVDYEAGTVTLTGTATAKITISANADMSSESDGAHTLRLKPVIKKITVDAVQNAVTLENNIESIAFMNKQISGKNYGEIATRQWLDAFIYTLNTGVVNKTIETALKVKSTLAAADLLDLSSYYNGSFTNFAVTKDDRIMEYLAKIENEMYAASNKGFTYILCGSAAARVFATMGKFKSMPKVTIDMDGVIGYLDIGGGAEVAIVRHQAMNALDAKTTVSGAAGTIANLVFGYRDPSGIAAPVGYFEYLPITATKVALNYSNSTQFSQSVFNFSNAETLIDNYIARGAFRLTSN